MANDSLEIGYGNAIAVDEGAGVLFAGGSLRAGDEVNSHQLFIAALEMETGEVSELIMPEVLPSPHRQHEYVYPFMGGKRCVVGVRERWCRIGNRTRAFRKKVKSRLIDDS